MSAHFLDLDGQTVLSDVIQSQTNPSMGIYNQKQTRTDPQQYTTALAAQRSEAGSVEVLSECLHNPADLPQYNRTSHHITFHGRLTVGNRHW
jgi:hypothetical protein